MSDERQVKLPYLLGFSNLPIHLWFYLVEKFQYTVYNILNLIRENKFSEYTSTPLTLSKDYILFYRNCLKFDCFVMQQSNALKFKVWDPLHIFKCPEERNHAVVVLNRPIFLGYDIVFSLWKKAKFTVTVDGGTDQWMNYIGEDRTKSLLKRECKDYLPTLVTGDMDSIDAELLKDLDKTESCVIRTPDQNMTDYTKALIQLHLHATESNIHLHDIYVLAETSGRFDHIIANINTLFKCECFLGDDTKVIQVASNSLTWLLKPGRHKILIPETLIAHKSWCALIPFSTSTSKVSTTGLKWDLTETNMKFGGLVSTSNTYNGSSEVTVTTSEAIIWSMGIEPIRKIQENCNISL